MMCAALGSRGSTAWVALKMRPFLQRYHWKPACWCGCAQDRHYLRGGFTAGRLSFPADLGMDRGLACRDCEERWVADFLAAISSYVAANREENASVLAQAKQTLRKLGLQVPDKPS